MNPKALYTAAKWAAFVLGGGFLLGLLILAILMAFLQTEFGRNKVADAVESLTEGTSFAVRLQGIGPGLPRHLRLKEVEVADPEGVWLRVRGVDVQWAVADGLKGLYHFPRIHADDLEWLRMPRLEETTDPEEGRDEEPFSIPELPELRIGEMNIKRLHINEALFGRSQEFTLKGSLDTATRPSQVQLSIQGITEVQDRIFLEVAHQPETGILSMDLLVDETPGGILGGLIGLPEPAPIHARLLGEGPADEWLGSMTAAIGGYGESRAEISLSMGREVSLGIHGTVTIEEARLEEELRDYLGNTANFRMHVARQEQLLTLKEAAITAGPVALDATGRLGLDQGEVRGEFELRVDETPAFLGEAGIVTEGLRPIRGMISGDVIRPTVDLAIKADRVVFSDVVLESAELRLQTKPFGEAGNNGDGLAASVMLDAGRLLLPGEGPALAPLQGVLELNTLDFRTFRIGELVLSSPGARVSGSGTLDQDGWRLDARLDLAVENLSSILPDQANLLPQKATAKGEIKGSLAVPDLDLKFQGTASGLQELPEAARSLTGSAVEFSAAARLKDKILLADRISLAGQNVTLEGSGRFDSTTDLFNGSIQVEILDLANLPLETTGSLKMTAEGSGSPSDFSLSGTAQGADLRISDQPVSQPIVHFSFSGLPQAVRGDFALTAAYNEQPVQGRGVVSLEDSEKLRARDLEIVIPGIRLDADLFMALSDGIVEGDIKGRIENLESVASLTGLDLAGSGNLSVRLDRFDGTQRAALNLDGKGLVLDSFSVSSFKLSGEVRDILESPGGSLKLVVERGEVGEIQLRGMEATLSGDLQTLSFKAGATGEAVHPFDAALSGTASLAGQETSVTLADLAGSYAGLPFRLQRSVDLTLAGEFLRLGELILSVGEGTIQAGGKMNAEQADFRASVTSLPLEFLALFHPIPATGMMNGSILLAGPITAPHLDAEFRAEVLLTPDDPDLTALPSTIQWKTELTEGAVSANVRLTGLGKEPVSAQLSFPAALSLRPFHFEVQEKGDLKGTIKGRLDLAVLSELWILEEHSLKGLIELNFDIAGSFDAPLLQGQASLSKGRYENYSLSILVDDMSGTILARGREFVFQDFSATDGNSGRLSMEGDFQLAPDRSFPFEITVRPRNFQVMRRPELSATAGGNIVISGNTEKAHIGGQLTFDPVRVAVADLTRPAIAELEVREINLPHAEEAPIRREARKDGFLLELDISLHFPARLYVTGRGLDAEFSGKLSVGGTSEEPVITGNLSVVRGTFNFLDRRFVLTQGSIILTGAVPPAPLLDVKAEWKRRDLTVIVNITGPAESPQIQMESDPILPSDEILARVLFGRSAADLTPLQALRLAAALRSLVSGGNGLDIMGTLERTFGLDELELADEPDGTVLGVGRYIRENVYLKLIKGLGSARDRVSVEVDLHENLSIESELGLETGTGIGVLYKRNY